MDGQYAMAPLARQIYETDSCGAGGRVRMWQQKTPKAGGMP